MDPDQTDPLHIVCYRDVLKELTDDLQQTTFSRLAAEELEYHLLKTSFIKMTQNLVF